MDSAHRMLLASGGWPGEFYVQQVRPYRKDQIAASLRSSMGADDPERPEYQIGRVGFLLDPGHVRKALESIHKYNYKPTLYQHDCVQRMFALNDEPALVICDNGAAPRPRIPFPYFAEVMIGFEYSAATHMLYAGMTDAGIECIANIRNRYGGEKRNPWDEAECGHHYARAMAAWSGLLALSGFRYDGEDGRLAILPKSSLANFKCFWSPATALGVFTKVRSKTRHQLRIQIHSVDLTLQSCGQCPWGKSDRLR